MQCFSSRAGCSGQCCPWLQEAARSRGAGPGPGSHSSQLCQLWWIRRCPRLHVTPQLTLLPAARVLCVTTTGTAAAPQKIQAPAASLPTSHPPYPKQCSSAALTRCRRKCLSRETSRGCQRWQSTKVPALSGLTSAFPCT